LADARPYAPGGHLSISGRGRATSEAVETRQAEDTGGRRLAGYSSAHVFRPDDRQGAIIAASAGAIAALLGLALLVRGIGRGISFATFGGDLLGVALLILAAQIGYWAWALLEMRYSVDDAQLVIAWGLTRIVVPVQQIQRIVLGQKYGEPHVRGLSWPGCHIGRARVPRVGEVLFYSAHRTAKDVVYISTPDTTFGLSLADPRGLARSIQLAQESAPLGAGPAVATYRTVPELGILGDSNALWLAAAAGIAFLVAAGFIFYRYQALPATLPLDYPPVNGAQRIGERGELMRLPLTALIWLLISFGIAVWAWPRLRTVCYSVLAGAVFVECLYAVAAIAAAR
jgi:hypothetical protein